MADSKTVGEINREHFDSVATTIWKQPWVIDLIDHLSTMIRSNVEWIGISQKPSSLKKSIKMLDYACGHGTAALALSPFVTSITGIDISAGMVEQFNQSARSSNFSTAQMSAIQGDLLSYEPDSKTTNTLSDPSLFGFDLAVMSMALHHVEDPDLMVEKLVERLEPGGVLLIVDWGTTEETGDGTAKVLGPQGHEHGRCQQGHGHGNHKHGHEHGHGDGGGDGVIQTVAHKHGFGEKDMLDMFSRAGLVNSGFMPADKTYIMPQGMGGEKRAFLARAQKPTCN